MKHILKLTGAMVALNLIINPVVKAENKIEIDYETTDFTNQEITAGQIKVVVDYQKFNYETDDWEDSNLKYKIYYDGVLKVDQGDFTSNFAQISLKDLDNDQIPEVIVETFSGGAHCCTNNLVYLWQPNKQNFTRIETGALDGRGGEFKDLNQDGKYEFVTFDNSFLYAFSSYAGSFPPSLILTIENGEFKDVTPEYPEYLKSIAWQMFKIIKDNENDVDLNGILAGYVAQKILLGEYEEGWRFMLAHYDKKSDWGLEIYDQNNNVIDTYRDFPTALKVFLIERGYLDETGQPIKFK